MFTKVLLFCFIYSFASLTKGVESALKSQKPWRSQTGCGSYFVKEMLHLFADEKIDNKIQQAITELDLMNRNKVAFTAGLATGETYSNKQILKFTKVITNIGGGLNASDGVFYCPEQGLYTFFINIMSNTNGAYAQIHKNDQFLMYVLTDYSGSSWKSGSNGIVLQLNRGDKVSVKSNGSVYFHPNATHFSGHKL